MAPRDLRRAIKEGRWTSTVGYRSLPPPPEEWTPKRRARLAVAIRAAQLFLFHGYDWVEIQRKLSREDKRFKPKCTKQRIFQYVDRGTQFLLSRGVFVEVGEKTGGGILAPSGK